MNERCFFHVDLDAFFAAVEQRDNPKFRNKPVVIGALPGNRGVVSTASYEARKFGIHSAMPISNAYKLCPHAIFIKPNMKKYISVSKEFISILGNYSPKIEQVSVDEAFIDMSNSSLIFKNIYKTAKMISSEIKSKLNITGSIGIAPNMFLSKIASDVKKPNGITQTPTTPEDIIKWLAKFKLSTLWGIGEKTEKQLMNLGIFTVKDLQSVSIDFLKARLGSPGVHLYNISRGIDNREISVNHDVKSISRERTFPTDCSDKNEWLRTLLSLSSDVATRARARGVRGRTITLTFRTTDFRRFTRSITFPNGVSTAKKIFETVKKLLENELHYLRKLRLIGVGISNFSEEIQTNFLNELNKMESEKWVQSEASVDILKKKFGSGIIFRGGEKK